MFCHLITDLCIKMQRHLTPIIFTYVKPIINVQKLFTKLHQRTTSLSSIAISLKVEPQLKDAIGELASEAMTM